MDGVEQVESYVKAYEWGGPTSALQLHHIRELSYIIRPGDTVVDLACGPGPLLLELAAIFPDTKFIGADLSANMLKRLEREATARQLRNVSVLLEDIRTLPSLVDRKVDVVISTSALHHVPDEESLRQVFERIRTLLKSDGGFYLFDFGLLKSRKSRALCVAEVAKLAPPITVLDYDLSLQAAFPIDRVLHFAQAELPRPTTSFVSAFVDFFYFLQGPRRTHPSSNARARISEIWPTLSYQMKLEHLMLRCLRKRRVFE